MTNRTNFVPNGFHHLTPYLVVADGETLLTFLKKAFAAEEVEITRREAGTIANGILRVGDCTIAMGQAAEPWKPLRGALHFCVPDTDATYNRAVEAGGTSIYEPADMPYGERSGGVMDPAGNHWYIATHTEAVSPDELRRRTAPAPQ